MKLREAIRERSSVMGPRPDLAARVETPCAAGWTSCSCEKRAREELLSHDRGAARSLRPRGRTFAVNDDVELAWLSGADSVHLG
jgi:thiamine monophosphate synthase